MHLVNESRHRPGQFHGHLQPVETRYRKVPPLSDYGNRAGLNAPGILINCGRVVSLNRPQIPCRVTLMVRFQFPVSTVIFDEANPEYCSNPAFELVLISFVAD